MATCDGLIVDFDCFFFFLVSEMSAFLEEL